MSIGKNTAVGLASNITSFGLGIVVSIVLTRGLGAEQRGVYVLLITTTFLLASLAHLSVGMAFSTLLARGQVKLGEANTSAVLLALGLGAVSILAVALAFQIPILHESIFKNTSFTYWLVALLLIPITIYQTYWNAMMTGLNRIVLLNQIYLAVNLSNAVLIIILVGVLQAGIPGCLLAWSLTSLLGAVGGAVQAARIEPFIWPPRRRTLRDMLSFGLRGHGANIAQQLFLRFDVYAVQVLVGTTGVGIYSLATSLAEKMWLPINAVYASSLGKIAQLPHEESALLTAKISRTALLMMFSIAIPFAVVSPWLIPFLYGQAFAASVLPLVVLIVGTLGFAVVMVLNGYILGQMQRPGLLSIISWLELAVSVPLYIVLTLWQGIVGAAMASTLTYILAMACNVYVFTRNSGLPASYLLVPRSSDFRDYVRVLQRGLRRVGVLRGA